ncbi:hypothetical protein CRG98_013501 [Punica granatum]|uniref:Uncharacterized protein n=1 Tax=Punica granatum TaxID=22663 RepID=A0A2I0KD94_PUNGR|nr:hypothetical protein CRG98_013501 [Punica granatum]
MELIRVKVESQGLKKYLRTCKMLADQLGEIGRSLDDEKPITYVLTGLPREYKSFITSLSPDGNPLSFGILKNKLIHQEQRLRQYYPEPPAAPGTTLQVQSQPANGSRGNHNGGNREGCSNKGGGRGAHRSNNSGCDHGQPQWQNNAGYSSGC